MPCPELDSADVLPPKANGGPVARGKAEGDPTLAVGPAASFEQLCQAFHLVYLEYLKCGYQARGGGRMRYTALQLLPASRTYVATRGGCVVGTGTVVLASAAGLPSSDVFGDQFESFRASGRLVAEATMLACVDAGGDRAHNTSLALIPWGIAWALSRGADDWCVVVNPKHLRFWRESLGMEAIAQSRPCDHVGGHPGILLRLPLRELRGGLAEPAPALRSRVLDRLPAAAALEGHALADEEVAVLLARKPQLLWGLTPGQRSLLEEHHPAALGLAEASSFGAVAA